MRPKWLIIISLRYNEVPLYFFYTHCLFTKLPRGKPGNFIEISYALVVIGNYGFNKNKNSLIPFKFLYFSFLPTSYKLFNGLGLPIVTYLGP